MELLPTIAAALVVAVPVFFSVRSLIKKGKRGDCGLGCDHCAGCGCEPADKK